MQKKAIAIKNGFRQLLESWVFLFFCLQISTAQVISYHSSVLLKQKKMRELILGLILSTAAEVYHLYKCEENVQYQHVRT